ncbi:MAG: B12-binding domain-containing radical SAM protein [Candidatus Aureabacteria bacterium]|nr:B12-binding domain-containing radical SAM protein [Candidatus Auribacterota bacterium]
MKVLFILKNENFLAPLGLCIISAIARREGHETYLCETHQDDPLDSVSRIRPDVVAYSSLTGEAKHYLRINERIKKAFPGIFTVMGGHHPTFFPEVLPESTLDAICRGEGEGAFSDLLGALSSGKDPRGIPNIVVRDGPADCALRPLVPDLDALPPPDYALLYDHTPMGSYPLKNVIASRGCPYNCTYCFNTRWNAMYKGLGRYVRRYSVEYVIRDIERIKARWPLSCVKFYDDIFVYRADEWLEEFSRKYRARVGIPFFILTRCDLLTEEMVKLLKHAGCRTISMSIEAGNPRIREEMLNRKMTNEQIVRAHRLCRKYGIYTFTNCIIGLPGTPFSADLESLDLSLECRVDWGEFLQFHPYPGTTLGDRTIAMGMYTPDYESMHTSYQFISPLNCFTDEEKRMQRNLALLGSVALVVPGLRSFIVNRLFRMKPNRFFTFLYFLAKQYALRRKIYVTRTSLWNSVRIFLRSLRQDIFRHTEDREG